MRVGVAKQIRRWPRAFPAPAAGLICLALASAAAALDPSKAITQYPRDAWTMEDGLPQSSVQAILQSRRGDLWLGTQGGLVRFDGARFEVFDRSNTPEIRSQFVHCLAEDSAGRLWAGTDGGVLRLEAGGSVAVIDELAGERVTSILADADGGVWIGTRDAGLYRWRESGLERFTVAEGLGADRVMSLARGTGGILWVGTRKGLARLDGGRFETLTPADGLASEIVGALHAGRDGALWAGTAGGLSRYAGGAFTNYTTADGLPDDAVWALAEDPDGQLWIATSGGLSRLAGGRITTADTARGLPSDLFRSLFVDREGSLWAGTFDAGLLRLGDGPFTTWGVPEGLSHDTVMTVLEDSSGDLWIGTFGGGLNRLSGDRIQHYTIAGGLASNHVWSLAEDADRALWIGTFGDGLNRLENGRFAHFSTADGLPSDSIKAILPKPDGGLLVGTGHGLARFAGGRFVPAISGPEPFDRSVTSLLRGASGDLWIGTLGGGLARWRRGVLEVFTTADGLSSDTVYGLHEDAEGSLWIATQEGGLNRLRDGRFTAFSSRDGLPDDTLHRVLEDDSGRLWLSSNRGIFHLERSNLEAFAAGELPRLEPVVYGTEDGLRSREASGGAQPAGWRGRDGRLWFPTNAGVSAVDPARVVPRPVPAPVVVDRVLVDGVPLKAEGGGGEPAGVVPAGAEKLEIHYAALSYLATSEIRFRYRLAGFERDWVAAGGRRQAFYTSIPPGRYRFMVSASYDGAAWSSPAAVELTLEPRFYQTAWFFSASLLAAALAVYGLYRLRLRRHERRERELARRVAESLDQIKVLRGMLPICSACKSIRDDQGYWNQLESYLRQHSQAELSHALCPSCASELYPEFAGKLAEPEPSLIGSAQDDQDDSSVDVTRL